MLVMIAMCCLVIMTGPGVTTGQNALLRAGEAGAFGLAQWRFRRAWMPRPVSRSRVADQVAAAKLSPAAPHPPCDVTTIDRSTALSVAAVSES